MSKKSPFTYVYALLGVVLYQNFKSLKQEQMETFAELRALEDSVLIIQRTTVSLCDVRLDFVWDGVEAADNPYDFGREPFNVKTDECGGEGDGFRCLTVGGSISPACYNDEECLSVCDGSCLNIREMQQLCG